MTFSQTDLSALRRASGSLNRESSTPGAGAGIPRPRSRWATRVLIPAAVLLATGGVFVYAARDSLRPRVAVSVVAAIPKDPAAGEASLGGDTSEPAEAGSGADQSRGSFTVQAPGWIEPAPFAVGVPALAEGVVKEVLVLEGERIEAGQVVARLIDDDARLALRLASAVVAQRDADVVRARAALKTAESQVEVERAAADELRDEVTRKQELRAIGGLSDGTFRRMQIRLDGLDAKVVTAQRMADEAGAALIQAESAHAVAVVQRDEADLRLARTQIRSTVAGVVLARLVEPGSRITMSSGGSGDSGALGGMAGAVLRVYDPAKLQVRVDVPLADAAKIDVGTRATISTEALPDQTFAGVVARVVHEANIQRNTVQFKVTVEQPSPLLKPEMLTRVRLHARGSAAGDRGSEASGTAEIGGANSGTLVLLVPTSAVFASGDGKGRVWIVDADGGGPVARQRDITTAAAALEGFVTVTSGLRITDRVILDSAAVRTMKDGTRIKVVGEGGTNAVDTSSATP